MTITERVANTLPRPQDVWPAIKSAVPATTMRVPRRTNAFRNRRIWQELERRVRYYADHPDEIEVRLAELDREWDIERTLETFAAATVMGGVGLSLRDKRFLAIPGFIAVTLLQYAIMGWCPPLPLLRRLGFRTQREIQAERSSLKTLKEAFAGMEHPPEVPTAKAV